MDNNEYIENEEEVREGSSHRGLKALIIVTICVLVLALLGTGYVIYTRSAAAGDDNYIVDDFKIAYGVSVNGVDLSGMSAEEARAAVMGAEQQKLDSLMLTIIFDGKEEKLSASDLGITTNVEEVLEQAVNCGVTGTFAQRQEELQKAQNGGMALTTKFVYDPASAAEAVAKVTQPYNTQAKDAVAVFNKDATDGEYFTYEKEVTGYEVDTQKLMSMIADEVDAQSFKPITAPLTVTEPAVTEEDLRNSTALIGTCTTGDLGSSNRQYNIKRFADLLNGTVLMPGETWSANDTAGPRTAELGWRMAGAINDGRMVQEPGGGVCQVSTTMYNAAIRAELEIVERHNHSIKSEYMDIGLDATIATGGQDLKLKNPYAVPVYFMAKVENGDLTCSVYGPPLPGYTVDFESETIRYIDQPADEYREGEYTRDGQYVAPGTTVQYRKGRKGRVGIVTKIYTYDDGTVKKEQFGGENIYPARSTVYYTNTAGGTYPIGYDGTQGGSDVIYSPEYGGVVG